MMYEAIKYAVYTECHLLVTLIINQIPPTSLSLKYFPTSAIPVYMIFLKHLKVQSCKIEKALINDRSRVSKVS